MPSATPLSVNDATPTAHVFDPMTVTPELATYRNYADAAVSASAEQLIVSLSLATSQRATNKVKVTISDPIEQTVDGVVVVRSTPRFTGEFILPDDMSVSERDHFGALVRNALAHADIKGYYEDLKPVY